MIQKVKAMPIGSYIEFKVGLCTKTIERINKNEYALQRFVEGWSIEYGDLEFIINYLKAIGYNDTDKKHERV